MWPLKPNIEKLKQRKNIDGVIGALKHSKLRSSAEKALAELYLDDYVDLGDKVKGAEKLTQQNIPCSLVDACSFLESPAAKAYKEDALLVDLLGETVLSSDTQKFIRDKVATRVDEGQQTPSSPHLERHKMNLDLYKTFFDYWRKTREERADYNKYFITLLFVQVLVAVATTLLAATRVIDINTSYLGLLLVYIFIAAILVSFVWLVKLSSLWELEKTQRFVLAKMEKEGFVSFPMVTLWMQKVNEEYATKIQLINLRVYRDNINYYGLPLIMMSVFGAAIVVVLMPSFSVASLVFFVIVLGLPLLYLASKSRVKTTKPPGMFTPQMPQAIATQVNGNNQFTSNKIVTRGMPVTWAFNVTTQEKQPLTLGSVPLSVLIDSRPAGTLRFEAGSNCQQTAKCELSDKETAELAIGTHKLTIIYAGDSPYLSSKLETDFQVT